MDIKNKLIIAFILVGYSIFLVYTGYCFGSRDGYDKCYKSQKVYWIQLGFKQAVNKLVKDLRKQGIEIINTK